MAFALGAAFGAGSGDADQFAMLFLPALAALGGWVSGVGALAAVLATLWLADRQRSEDVEALDIRVSTLILSDVPFPLLGVTITSTGKRPVLVSGTSFRINGAPNYLQPTGYYPGSDALPVRLLYGERLNLFYYPRAVVRLSQMLGDTADQPAKVFVSVRSTTREFEAKVTINDINSLASRYERDHLG
ncbi:hypothetical protein MCB86_08835 [Pseudomonas sp. KSR10]|uniref:hypothetical protein n=1 Tax=Pseudomonas sp. KSR10 TaxID=2916654 RepID=UPI001EF88623|nr:hypothetical protein [Pseudomonas sp. KSR10]MCG6540180.1 hypothetical protein [Pseudomonas sp. KSR10]